MQINPTAIQKITSFKNLDCLKNEHYYKDVEPLSKGTIGWFEPEDFEKFKEAFEFGDWRGPAMNALNNFNYEVLPIMMRIA